MQCVTTAADRNYVQARCACVINHDTGVQFQGGRCYAASVDLVVSKIGPVSLLLQASARGVIGASSNMRDPHV